MDKIEKIYLISIERSGCFRIDNIKNLKKYIKKYLNKDIHTVGIDCKHVYGNPDRINELINTGVFIKGIGTKRWYKTNGGISRDFKPGEIGCFLSHREAWIDMIKNNIKYALIFEDDSLITPEKFFNEINNIMNNLPNDVGYISLYHSPQIRHINKAKKYNDFLKQIDFSLWGTVSYIISLDLANQFIDNLLPIKYPIDWAISNYCISKNNIYLSSQNLVNLCDKRSIIR